MMEEAQEVKAKFIVDENITYIDGTNSGDVNNTVELTDEVKATLSGDGYVLDEAIEAIESVCKSRKQMTTPSTGTTGVSAGGYVPFPVEVTVGGAVAGPRLRVATVPYAFMANTARKSYGDFVVDGLIWATGAAKVSAMSAEGTTIAESAKVDSLTVAGDAAVGSLAAGALDGLGTVPLGAVILWYGKASEVPDGWALCDGTTVNGIQTPDLRGRFVVGTGSNGESSYNLGDQGGAETVTLTWNQMPKHTHTYTLYDTDSRHIADFLCSSDHGFWGGKNSSQTGSAGGSGDSAGAHENLPPYQTLNYIMRVN